MLSNEEKKALKELTEIKELVEEDLKYEDYNVTATLDQIDLESLVIILNLIEKQSREIQCDNLIIERAIKIKNKQAKEIEDHIENKELINQTLGLEKNANINKTLERIIILNNYEDKIKAKIEELENEHTGCTTNVFSVLQSLLEKE